MTQDGKIKIGSIIGGYEVIGIKKIIHGKYYPNTLIQAELMLKGKNGAIKKAFLKADNCITILKHSLEEPYFTGVIIYNGNFVEK